MWKWIKKIFRAIKNFFTEPKVRSLEEYRADAFTAAERERIAEGYERAKQLQYPSAIEQKTRYVYDEMADYWVIVKEKDVRLKGFKGWGGAEAQCEFYDIGLSPFKGSIRLPARKDFQSWSDEEVLYQFYVQQQQENTEKYKGLYIYRVLRIERQNYWY